ncbi:MAG: ABC transporter permease [Candidatus Omnitrophota bacterium]|jgi:ABC-type dipeptide/oligopeptide/nickel transport system permease subunit|nr:MAG: ABC transporter permease [Candidatus Omnitrophota bacterium]
MKLPRHPYIMVGGAISLLLIVTATFAPFICGYQPDEIDLRARYQPPSWQHWFGTDEVGRDVFSRVVYGARISLGIGLTTRTAGLLIGLIIGCLSGYYGGKTDVLLQRIVDVTLAFPFLLLVISIAVIFTEGLLSVFIALSAVMWAGMARIMRSQVMAMKEREYVTAIKAFGASDWRVIVYHILPNAYVPALIWWTMGLAQAIMAEAGLSFLGLGAQPPTPSWGSMIHYGSQAIRVAPWVSLFPGAALAVTVLGFNLLGEGLRDVLDPHYKH